MSKPDIVKILLRQGPRKNATYHPVPDASGWGVMVQFYDDTVALRRRDIALIVMVGILVGYIWARRR
jgi:hypothetical protein